LRKNEIQGDHSMLKKIVLILAIFALVASAGSVPAGKATTFTVNLVQPASVQGQDLKAGEYRLTLVGDKLTMTKGKQSIEVSVKVESSEQKFDNTAVRYTGSEKMQISEIRIGGTKTKLVFAN
jgi:hypothetical protein